MNSHERAEALARACSEFPWLGIGSSAVLLEWLRLELGSESALEGGIQTSVGRSIPQPPGRTLHIVSGNTPHAALQTLVRGLLLGGSHRLKLPTGGLEEVHQFLKLLPPDLASQVTVSETLEEEWLQQADLVVTFGSDETLAQIRSQLRPHQTWIGHGHKFGCGFVFGTWDAALILNAARDTATFDQMGCLSPIAFFVGDEPERFASELAIAMEKISPEFPRNSLSPRAAASIAAARNEWVFRQQTENNCKIWASPGSTSWTVVLDQSKEFPRSPLHRFILVKPMPQEELAFYFAEQRAHLSTAGVDFSEEENIVALTKAGFQRICPIGSMQKPSPFWHHDGFLPLAGRVRWIDVE